MSDFHTDSFDEATKLKLEIFRGYIREWLPVFLSNEKFREIHIYDFFCGPGMDGQGNPGSPLVIVDEVKSYIDRDETSLSSSRPVFLHFNDVDRAKIDELRNQMGSQPKYPNCRICFTSMDFEQAFDEALPSIKVQGTANLLIVDQFGIKAVNDRVFREVVDCSGTDMLFFISSSYIRRFVQKVSVQKYFNLPKVEIEGVSQKEIHRFICNRFYRGLIPSGVRYHLAPFSIEKDRGKNIYGIIFGTRNLLGLQKFLQVAWNKDKVTGEANFDIDDDIERTGQVALFEEFSSFKKQDRFESDLSVFIREQSPDNRMLYEFVLENGFVPKHANEMLRRLQSAGKLDVRNVEDQAPARKSAFYLSWKHYNNEPPRVVFRLIGD